MEKLHNLYRQIANYDTSQLSKELEKYDESALQRDVLYLYFMQLGKDMYTGDAITDLSRCNKDHIYPQSKVKDDSLLNNIVLVSSQGNGIKSDAYPINIDIRKKMTPFWQLLRDNGLISHEKFYRLTRPAAFSADEKWGFINRQLVENRQSTKAVAELLRERYCDSEVIYVKAGLVSDFRHEFNFAKSRIVNDLHHAKDAYLNIVVGNIYYSRFTRSWFMDNHDSDYSIKLRTVFSNIVTKNKNGEVVWRDGYGFIGKTLRQNFIHMTNYTFCRHGGFFDQNPKKAGKGFAMQKKDKPIMLYGGYDNVTASFFTLALTEAEDKKRKKELTLVAVDLLVAEKFLNDGGFAADYVRKFIAPKCENAFPVHFPLGRKPIRIKTVFEVDNGLRLVLNGKSNGGKILVVSSFSPLLLDSRWEEYIKRLESFCEKKNKNQYLIYSPAHDKFTNEENLRLYDLLIEKLKNSLFAKRPANPLKNLEKYREKFRTLPPAQQAEMLLDIIASFGRSSGNKGINFSMFEEKNIGNADKTKEKNLMPVQPKKEKTPMNANKTTLSSNFSNWTQFKSVCIVYSDASGLHETKSINLLDLIK